MTAGILIGLSCKSTLDYRNRKSELSPGTESNGDVELSYNFTGPNCNTGQQSFETLEGLCHGLQNDALNNNCAESLRIIRHQQSCQEVTGDYKAGSFGNNGLNNPSFINPSIPGSGTEIPAGSGTEIPTGSGTEIPTGSGTEIPTGSGTEIPTGSGSE